MMDANDIKWVRAEVQRQLNIVLYGQAGDNSTVENEDIDNLYQSMATIPQRPVMHPFGFVSRAAKGVFSVIAKLGNDPTNRMVLGHRDGQRPKDLDEGESRIYSLAGYQVICRGNGVFLRHNEASTETPLLLGTQANQFFSDLLDLIIAHTHAAAGAPPTNAPDFVNLKAEQIETKALTSTEEGGF